MSKLSADLIAEVDTKSEKLTEVTKTLPPLPKEEGKLTRDFTGLDETISENLTLVIDLPDDTDYDKLTEQLTLSGLCYGVAICGKTTGPGSYLHLLVDRSHLKALAKLYDFTNIAVVGKEYPLWALRNGQPAHMFGGNTISEDFKVDE